MWWWVGGWVGWWWWVGVWGGGVCVWGGEVGCGWVVWVVVCVCGGGGGGLEFHEALLGKGHS